MSKQDLQRELQAITPEEIGVNAAHILIRGDQRSQAVELVTALADEYPIFSAVSGVVAVHFDQMGLSEAEKVAAATGIMTLGLALRQLIELDKMPKVDPSS